MLRISKLADYGTVVMVYLARQNAVLSNAREIARQTHLTLPMVSKILKRLTGVGLLVSVRGVTGGYRLQRDASEISVLQIIYALEKQRGFTECSLHPNDCFLQGVCTVQENWKLISHAIGMALDSISLEALAKPTLSRKDIKGVRQLAGEIVRD